MLQQLPYVGLLPIEEHGPADHEQHVMGVIVEEAEAVASAGGFIVGKYRIPQAAGFAHDGQGAVAQGNHLAQAAGFKLGRHQEHIRTSVDPMGQRAVHLEARGYLSGILLLGPAEQVHVLGVAHAQHHQLHLFIHDLADHPVHQVQALLVTQAADDGDDGRFRLHIQAQFHLQRALARRFSGKIVHCETGRDQRIVLGIVFAGIDAVEYAGQMVLLGAEQAVHALAVIGGLNLFGIGGTDCGDLVTIDQTGLHEVGAAIALQLVIGIIFIAQRQHILHILNAKNALVLQVVDGEHSTYGRVERQLIILDAQQGRDHTALPVVGVDDIRLEADQGQTVEYAAAEEAKPLMLVAAHAVNVAAAKVIFVVHEVIGDAVVHQRFDAAVLFAPTQVHLEVQFMLHLVHVFFGDSAVQGQDHAHVVSFFSKHRRKRTHHVGQTAGFHKRYAFGRGKQDIQNISPLFLQ